MYLLCDLGSSDKAVAATVCVFRSEMVLFLAFLVVRLGTSSGSKSLNLVYSSFTDVDKIALRHFCQETVLVFSIFAGLITLIELLRSAISVLLYLSEIVYFQLSCQCARSLFSSTAF